MLLRILINFILFQVVFYNFDNNSNNQRLYIIGSKLPALNPRKQEEIETAK